MLNVFFEGSGSKDAKQNSCPIDYIKLFTHKCSNNFVLRACDFVISWLVPLVSANTVIRQ